MLSVMRMSRSLELADSGTATVGEGIKRLLDTKIALRHGLPKRQIAY